MPGIEPNPFASAPLNPKEFCTFLRFCISSARSLFCLSNSSEFCFVKTACWAIGPNWFTMFSRDASF